MKKYKLKDYLLLYAGIVIYSLSSVMSKAAALQTPFSWMFIIFYGAALFALALYAIFWQQILKRFSLITAYSNRPIVTILGMIWGAIFFHEKITALMILGTALIIIGIRLVVVSDE